MQSMSNQWLKILWPTVYSSITHWSSAIINDYLTDYLSITHRLHIDVIDFIDEICLELLHIGILATGSSLMTYFTGTRSNDEYKFTPIEARSNYSKYSFFHRFFLDWNTIPSDLYQLPVFIP